MPERTRPPFRADHVGSLLRPQQLREARARLIRSRSQICNMCIRAGFISSEWAYLGPGIELAVAP